MRLLAPIAANPWLLLIVLLVVLLIVGAALLVAANDRKRVATVAGPPPSLAPPSHSAAAPMEGLAALHTRLLELCQHLPPGTDDERWLTEYVNRLRATMNDAYDKIDASSPAVQDALLDRLSTEVEALAGVVNLQLGARLTAGTDRQALEAQLEALRESLT